MGAEVFEQTASGKNPADAFGKAVEAAQYDHGHSGYTGTIAEKGGYTLMKLPEGVTISQALEWVDSLGSEPAEHKRFAKTCFDIYDDKWGDALAFEYLGADLEELRGDAKDVDGTRWFLFTGWASS